MNTKALLPGWVVLALVTAACAVELSPTPPPASNGGASSADTGGLAGTGGDPAVGAGGTLASGTGGVATGDTAGTTGVGGVATGGTAGTAGVGGVATGGTAGTGAVAGAGGSVGGASAGGTAGAGGVAAGGTSGGGAGGSAGTGGTPVTESCTGCARLSVPLTEAGQRTPYIHFVTSPGMGFDMSSSVLTARVSVFAGTNGAVQLFAQNGEAQGYAQTRSFHSFSSITGFMEVSLDVGTQAGDASFTPTEVEAIGIEVHAGTTGPWTNPTVVYLDRLALSNSAGLGDGPWEFATSIDPLAINEFASPVAGSTITFLGP